VVLEERCVLPEKEAVVCTARCSGSNRKTNSDGSVNILRTVADLECRLDSLLLL